MSANVTASISMNVAIKPMDSAKVAVVMDTWALTVACQ